MTNQPATNNEAMEQVISKLRGNNEAFQEVSGAILSHDDARIKEVFSRVVGINLTDEQIKIVRQEHSSPEQIAALT